MIYRHKENGKFYDWGGINNKVDGRTVTFKCIDDSDEEPIVVFTKYSNPDKIFLMDEYKQEQETILKIFDEIEPVFSVSEQPKYIEVVIHVTCPICGTEMKWDGSVFPCYPPQYPHKCSKCGFDDGTRRFYNGMVVLAESKEDAYRIIMSGTDEEQKELSKRKVKK